MVLRKNSMRVLKRASKWVRSTVGSYSWVLLYHEPPSSGLPRFVYNPNGGDLDSTFDPHDRSAQGSVAIMADPGEAVLLRWLGWFRV